VTALAWLLGLVLPACGAEGAAGLPVPPLMDMTRIERPSSPNTFLAGPEGMTPKPDQVIPEQNQTAADLYQKARALFSGEPRTYVAAEFPGQMQIHYVVRSAMLNFPDLVTVQVNASGEGRSTMVIWSRSYYGQSDFGVNRDRTKAWLAALQQSNQR
jgi:uncharacterized protein (DUF1499 family)